MTIGIVTILAIFVGLIAFLYHMQNKHYSFTKRVFASLGLGIAFGATTEQLGMMDFAYAPSFARTWDIINVAGNVAK
ncbi:MAG: hypothetical protein GY919_03680 [Photobacterium aquimaris]|nr:hypothetical protein [Photobacterium aquimaris]